MGGHQRSSEYMTGGSRTRMADRKIVLLALDYRRTPFISGGITLQRCGMRMAV